MALKTGSNPFQCRNKATTWEQKEARTALGVGLGIGLSLGEGLGVALREGNLSGMNRVEC